MFGPTCEPVWHGLESRLPDRCSLPMRSGGRLRLRSSQRCDDISGRRHLREAHASRRRLQSDGSREGLRRECPPASLRRGVIGRAVEVGKRVAGRLPAEVCGWVGVRRRRGSRRGENRSSRTRLRSPAFPTATSNIVRPSVGWDPNLKTSLSQPPTTSRSLARFCPTTSQTSRPARSAGRFTLRPPRSARSNWSRPAGRNDGPSGDAGLG